MSITEGQHLKSSSNSKTFRVSCFWKKSLVVMRIRKIPQKVAFPQKLTPENLNSVQSVSMWLQMSSWLRELLLWGCTGPPSPHCPLTLTNFGEKFQPAFWVRAGIHVYIEAGVSLLFSDHVLTGLICYWGDQVPHILPFPPQLPQEHWGNLGHLPLLLG